MEAADSLLEVDLGSRAPGALLAWCRSSNLLAAELQALDQQARALPICILDPAVPEVGRIGPSFPILGHCG